MAIKAITIPGNTAWLKASPIKAIFRSTTKQPKTPQMAPTIMAAAKERSPESSERKCNKVSKSLLCKAKIPNKLQ